METVLIEMKFDLIWGFQQLMSITWDVIQLRKKLQLKKFADGRTASAGFEATDI